MPTAIRLAVSFISSRSSATVTRQRSMQRIHGTTHEAPLVRFERDERHALRPLPSRPLPVREQRLRRRVANDALVDVDTVRYSVPHQLVRDTVDVVGGEREVRIYRGTELVARHERSFEPHARVADPRHFDGLCGEGLSPRRRLRRRP